MGRSQYSEDSFGWDHRSEVQGIVTPVEIERDRVTLRLELDAARLSASWPRLVDTAAVRRRAMIRECYFE